MLIAREIAMANHAGVEVICVLEVRVKIMPSHLFLNFVKSHSFHGFGVNQVAVVVGGRNFFSGDSWVAATGIDKATAYQIGFVFHLLLFLICFCFINGRTITLLL